MALIDWPRLALFALVQIIWAWPAMADFRVCQQTDHNMAVAYSYYDYRQQGWFVVGWYTLSPRSCMSLHVGNVRKNRFYVYAEIPGTSFKWTGDLQLCVQRPNAFHIRNVGQFCPDTEKYHMVDTGKQSDYTWTFKIPQEQRQALLNELNQGNAPSPLAKEPSSADQATPKKDPPQELLLASPETCHLSERAGTTSGPGVSVNLKRQGSDVRTGDPVTMEWKVGASLDGGCRTPLYVAFATPMRVRFEGDKFLAFPPGARAPYDIKFRSDQTRVFVPLHAGAGQLEGRVVIKTYAAGAFQLDWALVEVPKLRANPRTKADLASGREKSTEPTGLGRGIAVIGGNPLVVVRDHFSLESPKRRMRSNSGEFELQVFDEYYRVLDAGTGELLQERAGWDPNFSPTSRFLGAYSAGPGFEIIDLYSGQVVTSNDRLHRERGLMGNVHLAAWSPGDAILALSVQLYGGIEVLQSLVDGSERTFQGTSCHYCAGINSALRADSEAGIASFQGPVAVGWASLLDRSVGTDAATKYAWAQIPEQAGDEKARAKVQERRQKLMETTSTQSLSAFAKAAFFEPDEFLKGFDPDDAAKHVEDNWRFPDQMHVSHVCLEGNDGKCVGRLVDWQATLTDPEDINARLVKLRVAHDESALGSLPQVHKGAEHADARLVTVRGSRKRGADDSRLETLALDIWHRLGLLLPDAKQGPASKAISQGLAAGDATKGLENTAALRASIVAAHSRAASVLRASGAGDYIDSESIRVDSYYGLAKEAKFIDPRCIRRVANWQIGNRNYWLIGCFFDYGASSRNWLFLLHGTKDGPSTLVDLTHRLRYRVGKKASGLDDTGQIEITEEFATTMGFGGWPGSVEAVRLAFNRYLIASGFWTIDNRRWVLVFDLEAGQIRFFNRDVPEGAALAHFALTEDAATLLQVNTNGHFFVYEVATEKLVLRGFDIDDELVVFDARGYYVATPEGAQFVHLKFPGLPGYNSFSQFARTLHRPDVVRAVLSGKTDTPDPRLTPPPKISFDAEVVGAGTSRFAKLKLIAASAVGLEKVRVFVDGRLAGDYPMAGREGSAEATLVLSPEARWVTAVAIDRTGYESVPQGRDLAGAAQATSSRLFAIAVGTDVYDDSANIDKLTYAKSDADKFATSLQGLKGSAYGDVQATSFLDAPGLRSTLPAKIGEIVAQAGEQDTIMLFAAGHGFRDPSTGQFYLALRESRLDRLEATSISWTEIATALEGARARVMVILDACHSGAAGGATNDDAVAALLGTKGSITVLAAAKGRQSSLEYTTGGAFTTALVNAITTERKATDTNGNGALELAELYGAVKRDVVAKTKGEQTPWIARNQMVGEIPLF